MFSSILRRDILILICVKGALLAVLYLLFFSPSHQINVTPSTLRTHLTDSQP